MESRSFKKTTKFKMVATDNLKINRNHKRVSIKMAHQSEQKSMVSREHKQIGNYQFSQTVSNLRENKKDQKVIWISRRGSINFHIMENQDHMIMFEKNEHYQIYGILDGSGAKGKRLAEHFGNKIIKFLVEYGNGKGYPEEKYAKKINKNSRQKLPNVKFRDLDPVSELRMKKTSTITEDTKQNESEEFYEEFQNNVTEFISNENRRICKQYGNQMQTTGCTLLLLVILNNRLFCFNVGASKAVLARKLGSTNQLSCVPLNVEQNLSRLDQKTRILSSQKAIIEKSIDENGYRIGPQRIWKKGTKFPGLAITRCLGMQPSVLEELGILSIPESLILNIKENYQFVLLGSDGFWKVFEDNRSVMGIFQEYWQKHEYTNGVQSLLNQAVKRWNQTFQLMDDISIMLIKLS